MGSVDISDDFNLLFCGPTIISLTLEIDKFETKKWGNVLKIDISSLIDFDLW